MNIFIESHQQLLKSLIKHQVNFLLIGGYAVITDTNVPLVTWIYGLNPLTKIK